MNTTGPPRLHVILQIHFHPGERTDKLGHDRLPRPSVTVTGALDAEDAAQTSSAPHQVVGLPPRPGAVTAGGRDQRFRGLGAWLESVAYAGGGGVGGNEGADVVGEVGVGQGEVEVVDVADGGWGVVDDGSDGGRDGGGAGPERVFRPVVSSQIAWLRVVHAPRHVGVDSAVSLRVMRLIIATW
ncbi:hypothetical protein ABZZ78_29015, partial [Streptomyces sp. NPDC006415]